MMRASRLRWLRMEWWLVGLLSTAIALFMVFDRTTERLDRLIYDSMVRWHQHAPDPRILLVTIDQRSLQEVGAWPWTRETHARLIGTLAQGRPKAIAYDILFVDSKPGDGDLASAMATVPVYLPLLFDVPGSNGRAFDSVLPVEPIRHAAAGFGHVNLISDGDGLVRRIRRYDGDARERWPHLMELVRRAVQPDRPGPTSDDTEPRLLSFAGPPGHFPSIDAATLLRGEFPPEILRDRIVLVGATAQGLGDRHPTALSAPDGVMPGLEVQANFLDQLLSGRSVLQAGPVPECLLALIPLWLLLIAFTRLQPRGVVAATLVLAVLVLTVSIGSLFLLHQWLSPAPALVMLALVYPLWGWRRLAAVSGYMIRELETLRAEPDVLAPSPTATGRMDPVSRQTLLLNEAIGQVRDMRRFVADSLDQLPDALFVVNEGGSVLLANAAGKALLAQAVPAAGSDIAALIALLQPADEAASDGNWPTRSPSAWPPAGEESRQEVLLPDGRCFDLRIAPRLAADGHRIGWIVRMTDVSFVWAARQQREETLRFLSHDMRTPLTSILALTGTAPAGDFQPDMRQRINGYARRTLELADGFIHLARAQMLRFRPEPINLSDLLKDAVDELWPQISARNIEATTIGEDQDLLVMGERSLLTRALINLIDNAIKYGGEGGHLTCSLSVQETEGHSLAVCAITDTGPGMPADLVDRLFERFQRDGRSHVGGAGLGLSFVQTVARRHGGAIRCDSKPGEGTTFTLILDLLTD